MLSRIRFSKLDGKPVTGPAGDEIGRIADCVVRLVDAPLPLLTGMVVHVEGQDYFVPVALVDGLSPEGARLARPDFDRQPFQRRPGEVLLGRDVQGRGVIDVSGARLVRVQDVVLNGEANTWHVAAIIPAHPLSLWSALGIRSAPEQEIGWMHIEPLTAHVPTAGRSLRALRLQQLRPADIADIVEEATHEEGEEILEAVQQDPELEADVFEELDEEHQTEFLKDRTDPEAAEVLANMEPDAAADLLMQLDQPRRRPILNLLPDAQQRKVRALLGYNPETAGGLMSSEFVALPETTSVQAAIGHLRSLEEVAPTMTELYTVDGEDRLSGTVTVLELIRARDGMTLEELAPSDPIAVFPDADLPAVAVEMADYNLAALPVVDDEGHILGVITYDDLIEAMLPDDWRRRGGAEHAQLAEQAGEGG